MVRHRGIILTGLFVGPSTLILVTCVLWMLNTTAHLGPLTPPGDYATLVFLLAAAVFLAGYGLRWGLGLFLGWAIRHGHWRILGLALHLFPRFTRHTASTLLGAGLVLSSIPTAATAAPHHDERADTTTERTNQQQDPTQRAEVIQLPLPSWTPAQVSIPLSRLLGATSTPQTPHGPKTEHVVTEGESLWSIAAQQLGAQATAGDINALWPRIYELNRSIIGDDPDLIRPGLVLQLPPVT